MFSRTQFASSLLLTLIIFPDRQTDHRDFQSSKLPCNSLIEMRKIFLKHSLRAAVTMSNAG